MAASPPPYNPYTANDIAGARAIVEEGIKVLALIDACHACTMDFSASRQQVQALMAMAQGIITKFSTGADTNA